MNNSCTKNHNTDEMEKIANRNPRSPFRKELERLINKCSQENRSNTPDFILADYLFHCLEAFDAAVNRREVWYGRLGGDETPLSEK